MNKYGWADAAVDVMPYIVRIELPDGYGSGFVINYRQDRKKRMVVIATAFHVIEHAEKWGELIRVIRGDTVIVLSPADREIYGFEDRDLALLVFDADGLKLPKKILQSGNTEEVLPPGFPVGWCGFPNIADKYECFFAGHISTALSTKGDYLVDGVTIHGISGGPAFIHVDNKITLIGVVSAYYPNRATGESLPGMSLIRSVNPFTEFFEKMYKEWQKRIRKARRQKGSKTNLKDVK